MSLVAKKVHRGGFFHFATDWENYAGQATDVLSSHPDWELLPQGEGVEFAIPSERPRTRFEQRGIDAGRSITDLVAIRR
jgi:tRNA (guanine-N7-)-methyltransferase